MQHAVSLRVGALERRITPALSAGLIGYWPFDGDGTDHSPARRDLTLYGNPGFGPGILGQALDLHNNTSQYAQRPVDDAAYDFGATDFSVQAWINFHSQNQEPAFFEKFTGQSGPGWTLQFIKVPSDF